MYSFAVLAIFSAILEASLVSSSGNTLPDNFKRCKANDPNLGRCMEDAVPDAFRKMKKDGIPSLGVFPLEPLLVKDIRIEPYSRHSPVNLKLHFKNIKMYGIPDSVLSKYDARIQDARLSSEAYTPELWFEADYVADGRILVLPVRGAGRCKISMYQLKTITDLRFKPEVKDGETYWMIQEFRNKFAPQKMTMYFDGILNGDKLLSNSINKFLNENWQVIFEELRPAFEEAFGQVFKEITHRVFSKVPIDKIFES